MDTQFKEHALRILKGHWKEAILVTLIASILGGAVSGTSFDITFGIDSEELQKLPSFITDLLIPYLIIVSPIATILGLAQFILGGMIQLGHCKYLLKLHDGMDARLEDLFSESDRFLNGFLLHLLISLFVTLWAILLVIPGIIAAIRYSQAFFLLCENPQMTPMEAINRSKEIMDGHKMEYFLLDLSFIGWIFLGALTLGIGYLWLSPYMSMAHACFYRNLCPQSLPIVDAEVIEA